MTTHTTSVLDPMVRSLALVFEKSLRESYESYLEACEEDWKAGHRPHYCEHGVNLWTDYDNICGYCEDGVTMSDGIQRRAEAIRRAKVQLEVFNDLLAAAVTLRKMNIKIDEEAFNSRLKDLFTCVYAI